MPTRVLPARADLDHLKHEAKALHKAALAGDADAIARAHDIRGDTQTLKLAGAQRAIAREYGFPTWAKLRAHAQAARGSEEAIAAFLDAVQEQDADRARQVLDARPQIAAESIHVAAALGRADDVARLIADDPSRVSARRGRLGGDPLLCVCFSPFLGESAPRDAGLLDAARVLLGRGADPNTREETFGVPALYAVTGQRSVLPVARVLLAAGANPTDGESLHHAAERDHEDALELLLAAGADLNDRGTWGNTPLYFLIRWYDIEQHQTAGRGVRWLLAHGADPNVLCGPERETALHLSARLGQRASLVQLLLAHGADVHLQRADGRTPWRLAARGGLDEIAGLLERAGAAPEPLSTIDALLAACGRGDAGDAHARSSPELVDAMEPDDLRLLVHASAMDRDATVLACVAAGFPVDTLDEGGATALHYAAIRGRVAAVRALLAAGASFTILDREHSSGALGWACWGADFIHAESGDYAGCARALLDAGARLIDTQYRPKHAGIRRELERAALI
jgi:ankyrin repeat protein